jgi:uncharacterized membrane protein
MTDSTTHINFEFSIRQHLKQAWKLFTAHIWYFLILSAVTVVLNIAFNTKHHFVMKIIGTAATLLWSYITISSVLAAVDGKDNMLSFEAFKGHLPTGPNFLRFVGIGFGSAVIIFGGLILLIIPGIYFMIRLMFANFAFVDQKQGIAASMRFSWHLVRKDIFWTSFLCFIIATAIILFGIVLAGVGVLVTYPVGMLFLALLYRELTKLPQPVAVAPKVNEPTASATETPTAEPVTVHAQETVATEKASE